MVDIRQTLSLVRNKQFEQRLEPLCPGEVWRIMRGIEQEMDSHAKECEWCVDVGCEVFNSMLIKYTAARHRIGIN